MPALNPNLVDTGTPPIPEAQAWARAYEGARGPLIDLSQAVPGYPPHPEMLARLAATAGDVRSAGYGSIFGDMELREAYAAHQSELYGAAIRPTETAITAGCNQAFVIALMALAKAGDAVLLPSPWYFNHEMTCRMLGVEARPLPCAAEAGFVPDPEAAEALIDGRVKAILLITPNNPTGAVYPPETLERFAALCRRRGIWLVVDETYRDFLQTPGRPHGLFADPQWRDTVIGLYSFSKSYCIPGHRLGAVTAAEGVIAEIGKVLDCIQICPARAGQTALAWAIPALAEWREANRLEITARADAFRAAFQRLPGWRVDSIGAYFAYVAHPFAGVAAPAVARKLAQERGVLALPGGFFGAGQDGHLRVAFANADREAIAQLPGRLEGLAV
ncbi:aspartate/tyrosine/aromatic aminotransferase [Alsobacter soli]|uniref:aspartate transaminase n=1 Tax=Alsobacter soli TaxID=2109933 RepID=A0A2T1HQI4_9HYPH|nr:aminotransferase [Alsobacter soli]PSC03892.1 aspartate/tyrosine/aromatic aminotransferase [Alsobacter soli]